jgi:hypothetical protein
MNEELQKQLAISIHEFSNTIGQAKDFAIDQAPDIIQQFLYWGIAQNVLTLVMTTTVVYLSYMATFKWANQEKDYHEWAVSKLACAVISGICIAASTISSIGAIYTLTQILISPKIYLIKEAAKLL